MKDFLQAVYIVFSEVCNGTEIRFYTTGHPFHFKIHPAAFCQLSWRTDPLSASININLVKTFRIILCQDAPQTHQLFLQYFLHLQMHPMNSTSADYGQNRKHMASHHTSERNLFSGFIILYLNHRCMISVYFIQFSMCSFLYLYWTLIRVNQT